MQGNIINPGMRRRKEQAVHIFVYIFSLNTIYHTFICLNIYGVRHVTSKI
jgi:hypothetical protein